MIHDIHDLSSAIAKLVEYNFKDEMFDFQQHHETDGGTHIFRVIVALDNFLNETKYSPEDWLAIKKQSNV